MERTRKVSKCGSRHRQRHRVLKENAKSRVDHLQGLLAGLQSARKDGRAADVALLEEQVHQMLCEWKAELNGASPAVSSSLLKGNSSDLSSYIRRMLQLNEEEDDATSKLVELPQSTAANLKAEPLEILEHSAGGLPSGGIASFLDYFVTQPISEHAFLGAEQYKITSIGVQHAALNCQEGTANVEFQQFNLHQELPQNIPFGFSRQNSDNFVPVFSEIIPELCPPPAAFLRQKCALWDCPRTAHGSEWFEDYCSSFHAVLALNEGPPGMTPVMRPGGIDLKDGPLFAALAAKTQGKNVGIPECEGAATTKSPWNAPELFDLLVLNGESLREWLFFDKPRRAFESGNRKQRSLPDYSGRGWHESRKQVMKEFRGLKRSYYMDPQPLSNYEWHLYEYEINDCDACALYRLELKLVDPKKSNKAKVASDSLLDLQQQMGRLNSGNTLDNKRQVKGRANFKQKDASENVFSAPEILNHMLHGQKQFSDLDHNVCTSKGAGYGTVTPYAYSTDSFNGYQ